MHRHEFELPAEDIAASSATARSVRQLFTAPEVELLTRGIQKNLDAPSPRAKVASRPDDPGWFFEDFCNWRDNDEYRRFIFDSRVGSVASQLMGGGPARSITTICSSRNPTRASAPLAPGPALLQRRRAHELQHVDAGGSGRARGHAGVRGGLAPGALADAAHLPGQPGQVVSGRQPGGSARHRGRPLALAHPGLGAGAGRRRVLPHADAARVRRRGRRPTPARVLGALPGRGHAACAARLADLAGVSGLEQELPAGAPLEHALFPVLWPRA